VFLISVLLHHSTSLAIVHYFSVHDLPHVFSLSSFYGEVTLAILVLRHNAHACRYRNMCLVYACGVLCTLLECMRS